MWLVLTTFLIAWPHSPVHQALLLREYVQSKFVMGEEDQAYWYLTLAKKRLAEAQALASLPLPWLASSALIPYQQASFYQKLAQKYIDYLRDKTNINYLVDFSRQLEPQLENFQKE